MQNYKTVLVVTYGRSGSTLLQGLLNSIDGYIIRGENTNLFRGFFTAYAALQSTLKMRQAKGIEPSQAWYGAAYYDADTFLGNLRRTATELLRAGEDARCIGFKEIRYHSMVDNPDELMAYLDFLQVLFEDACIVFNTRNLPDTVISGFWRNKNPETLTRQLQKLEDIMLAYGKGRDNFFHLDYDDMVGHSDRIEALFEFLGETYDRNRIDAVLSIKHSSVTAELPNKQKKEMKP